jgi:hypothetical protein
MITKNMKSIKSGMVYPIPLDEIAKAKQQEKDYGLIEVRNEEFRTELAKMFSWMYNYPGKTGGIMLDNLSKDICKFRREEIVIFAKKMLGKDWSCEELC